MVWAIRTVAVIVGAIAASALATELELRRVRYHVEHGGGPNETCAPLEELWAVSERYLAGPDALEAFAVRLAQARSIAAECSLPSASEVLQVALAARPTWPRAHVQLALAHAAEGSYGIPFLVPFLNAQAFGPYEPGVQRMSVQLVDVTWEKQSDIARTAAAQAALRMSARPGRGAWIESLVERSEHQEAWCRLIRDGLRVCG